MTEAMAEMEIKKNNVSSSCEPCFVLLVCFFGTFLQEVWLLQTWNCQKGAVDAKERTLPLAFVFLVYGCFAFFEYFLKRILQVSSCLQAPRLRHFAFLRCWLCMGEVSPGCGDGVTAERTREYTAHGALKLHQVLMVKSPPL